jgi:hypothetical protein
MGSLERIRQEWNERNARFDAARAAVEAFTPIERQEFCAELCARVEAELAFSIARPAAGIDTEMDVPPPPQLEPSYPANVAPISSEESEQQPLASEVAENEFAAEVSEFESAASTETESTKPHVESKIVMVGGIAREVPAHLRRKSTKKTDRAEAIVWLKFEGIHTFSVASRIEQSDAAAANTLRQVQKRRGTIVEIDGKWFPTSKENWKLQKVPLREAIVKVLSEGPLGTSGIVHAVRTIRADAQYPSIAAEITRLASPKMKVLVPCGSSGRGALYALNRDAALLKKPTTDGVTTPKTPTTEGVRPTDVLSTKDARPNGALLNGGAHTADPH